MVEAIFYVLRTAVAWRDLPACYGPWNSVYTRWRRWCALGLWQEILRLLSRHAEGRVRYIDGSHVKCHQFATNPAGGQSAQAIGRTKGGLNTKICALVEGRGRLTAVAIAPGQTLSLIHISFSTLIPALNAVAVTSFIFCMAMTTCCLSLIHI